MTNKILGTFLLLLGLSFFIPAAFKIFIKLAVIFVGLFLIYKGLQLIGAHSVLFHVDRFIDRVMTLFH